MCDPFSSWQFICWCFHFLPPNIPSAHRVSQSKRPRLLYHLVLPYNKFASQNLSPRSRKKIHQVFPRPNGVESEQSSDVNSDMTSDLTDVTSDFTDISSITPSLGVLKNIEQGTLGVVVRGDEGRKQGSVLIPWDFSFLFLASSSVR